MRTDNLPTNISQSSSLTAKAQGISLSNQLLGSSDNADSFDRVLNSQVDARESRSSATQSTSAQEARQEASPRSESGKRLPDDRADRLQDKQQADRRRQADASEARQAENSRDGKERAAEARNEQGRQASDRQEDARQNDQRASRERVVAQGEAGRASENQTHRERAEPLTADAPISEVTADEGGIPKDAETSAQQLAFALQQDGEQADNLDDFLTTQAASTLNKEAGLKDQSSDIVISPELLANVSTMEESIIDAPPSEAELALLADLSDEERLALEEASVTPVQIEGEGFADLEADVDPEAIASVMNDGFAKASTATQDEASRADMALFGTKKESPKPVITPSMSPSAMADAEEGGPAGAATKPGNAESVSGEELAGFEAKTEKKSDLGVLADKMQSIKPMAGEGIVASPVQERLAALAKALDKAMDKAASSSTAGQGAAKPAEAQDGAKATPFQRSLEQMSRAPTNIAKPFGTNIQAPLQSREWAGEVGQRLMMMVSSRLNSAQIQLNPREMGPIDVKVSVQHDQASVVFTSHAAPTREALEQALPRLREMMEQNGVALGDVDVRDHDAHESDQRRGQDHRQGGSADAEVAAVDESSSDRIIQQAVGLVDYYA
ncbi:flagellar hook-length control protein FliK [Ketobacter alkanivorans]|uniref:Flagellar hook-length control protein-like C-terminal domain-containing protein n=1 Tax=Ketobacter alkanivorans TaxID=1917421 RepID=A0A2K9LPX1_9GAMM|nr:flagellar hook-length control protein FliK [Ketobacter alkanivorans]AUM14368.1 hypothetical protein Kalk_18900 [Ketobacter alkanivorans]